jgi:hypothetical protein
MVPKMGPEVMDICSVKSNFLHEIFMLVSVSVFWVVMPCVDLLVNP